ncbi:hypothetical protein OH77DRAFT_1417465 [Trametes cingulata]|nr:hypothetical protein OH77DRAFT_1417465 [Trametes cingulata]
MCYPNGAGSMLLFSLPLHYNDATRCGINQNSRRSLASSRKDATELGISLPESAVSRLRVRGERATKGFIGQYSAS